MSSTAREAALKIILEDVEPLIQRMEECGLLLARVETDLKEDLTALGGIVQKAIDAQATTHAAAKRLTDAVQNAQTMAEERSHLVAKSTPPASAGIGLICLACFVSSMLSAGLVAGVVYAAGGSGLVEDARLGKALSQAWSSLDQTTKNRVTDAMKSNQ